MLVAYIFLFKIRTEVTDNPEQSNKKYQSSKSFMPTNNPKKKKNQLEYHLSLIGGFPGGAVVKNLPANAGASRDTRSIPGLRRSPGEGNGNPLQYSCWKTPWTEEPGGLYSPGGRRESYTTE